MRTTDRALAKRRAVDAWQKQLDRWEGLVALAAKDAVQQFEAAKSVCVTHGVRHVPVEKAAALPLGELLERLEASTLAGTPHLPTALALLGIVKEPPLTVSGALAAYWKYAEHEAVGKSPEQVQRWAAPRRRAIANFIAVNGDVQLAAIEPDHMAAFHHWWLERTRIDGLAPTTANKDFSHIKVILETVARRQLLNLSIPLDGWRLKGTAPQTRPPFSRDWIKTRILAPHALNGLDGDARCALLGMINTGYRPSEGVALRRAQIRLDANIPHISIEPVGRALKTRHAERVIPLAGVSLEAFRARPDGFTSYSDGAGALSGTINRYIRHHGLAETAQHTLYGLRHGFEDRMLEVGVDERVRRDLMGHALNRVRYGAGASLEHAHRIVECVAL
jgi:integrase